MAALYEDRLTDYIRYTPNTEDLTGQVRLGKIIDIVPALSACFVDIGLQKEAFFPVETFRLSSYKKGQEIPVQIKRNEENAKGVMVTDEFTIPGRYLILSHKNRTIGVSGKITDRKERTRLKTLSKAFKGLETAGYIFRTECAGIEASTLETEASELYDVYQKLLERVPYARVGNVLYSPGSCVIQFLAEYKKAAIESIQIETSIPYEKREDLLNEIKVRLPYLMDLVSVQEISNGFSLADIYKIPAAVSEALKTRVFLESGGYLFIEETEALSVIDVNSSSSLQGDNKEEALLKVNLEATKEIARQIRLRNLTGIIVIDYINMEKRGSERKVYEALKAACFTDTHKVRIYGFTALGLMELTRDTYGKKLKEMV